MNARVIQVIGPAPLTLDQAYRHLNIIRDDDVPPPHPDDDYIKDAIDAAISWAEGFTRMAITPKKYELVVDNLPGCNPLILPFAAPLISVDSVHYIDLDNVEQLLPQTQYHIAHKMPAVLQRKHGATFPPTSPNLGAVRITYSAGYASPLLCPPDILRALKQVMADFFENREDSTPLNLRPIGFSARNLLQPRRIYCDGAA